MKILSAHTSPNEHEWHFARAELKLRSQFHVRFFFQANNRTLSHTRRRRPRWLNFFNARLWCIHLQRDCRKASERLCLVRFVLRCILPASFALLLCPDPLHLVLHPLIARRRTACGPVFCPPPFSEGVRAHVPVFCPPPYGVRAHVFCALDTHIYTH